MSKSYRFSIWGLACLPAYQVVASCSILSYSRSFSPYSVSVPPSFVCNIPSILSVFRICLLTFTPPCCVLCLKHVPNEVLRCRSNPAILIVTLTQRRNMQAARTAWLLASRPSNVQQLGRRSLRLGRQLLCSGSGGDIVEGDALTAPVVMLCAYANSEQLHPTLSLFPGYFVG